MDCQFKTLGSHPTLGTPDILYTWYKKKNHKIPFPSTLVIELLTYDIVNGVYAQLCKLSGVRDFTTFKKYKKAFTKYQEQIAQLPQPWRYDHISETWVLKQPNDTRTSHDTHSI